MKIKKEINICDIRRDLDAVNAYRSDADDSVCGGGNLCSYKRSFL